MTVSTIASLATGITRNLSNQNTRYADSVRSLIAGENKTFSSGDIAKLSAAAQLQNQIANIRGASQNLAAASSLLDVADGGAAQISRALDRMRDLSARATGSSLTGEQRTQLDTEFQALRGEINRIASTTSFGGQVLLDGSLKNGGEKVGGTSLNISIDGLTDEDFFADGANLLSPTAASAVGQDIRVAQNRVNGQRNEIGALAQNFDFAAATIESAIQNIEASRATLTETDIFGGVEVSDQARFQAQANASLLSQTNKLPGNILSLLGE